MKKRIAIIILVLAIVSIVFWRISASSTAHARNGPLTLAGNVDIREVNLGFRVPGRILEVRVDEGDAVTNNMILARVDPEPYERALQSAKAAQAAASAKLAMLQAGYRTQEVAQARAALRERATAFENAKRTFERRNELLRKHTISQQDRDDAEALYREAEAQLNSAREQVALMESGYRPEEIATAKAEAEGAQAAVASAQLQLHDTVLESPSSGVILTRAQEPGAIVQAGATVLTLSLENPVWVRAYVHEPELGLVPPGTRVQVFTDSRPELAYAGQVGYVSPRAEFTPRNVETKELRTSLVYRVRVTVENPDKALRQGMPVTVKVVEARQH